MGFRQPGDGDTIISQLRALAAEVQSGYNDGWTASTCKYQLYLVKCYLDDVYPELPKFQDEDDWTKERMWEKLKR